MRFRPIVSLLLLAAYLPACTSYQATTQPVAELAAAPKPPEHLRVTTTAGAKFVVDAPRVVNDSLFGTTVAVDSKGMPTTQAVAMPLAELRTVEVKKADGTSTMLLVAGVVAVGVAMGIAMSHMMDGMLDGFTFSAE